MWETLDLQAIIDAQAQWESTYTASSGSYAIPIGGVLRREIPGGGEVENPTCPSGQFCDLDAYYWNR